MLTVSSLKHYLQQASNVSASLARQADTIPTLAIQWDKADELVWTLRLTEFFGDASGGWGYQPDVNWEGETAGKLAYADSPLSADDSVEGTCSCRVSVRGDALLFELEVCNHSSRTWTDCWGWLCLIHRWAQAFQANCELPAGTAEQPWVPANALAAPLQRWLKWCPVATHRDEAGRIGGAYGPRWQPHIQNREGAVRAWRVEGNRQQFIQLQSPDAALLGWSHWPCTDMGVYFGTLEPGQSGRISGRLEFSEREFEPI